MRLFEALFSTNNFFLFSEAFAKALQHAGLVLDCIIAFICDHFRHLTLSIVSISSGGDTKIKALSSSPLE